MPAGVVDDLELIDVEIAKGVRGLARFRALQRSLEPALELAAVDEPCEEVVARMIGEAAIQLTGLGDVVEDQDAARHPARAIANRSCGALDIELIAVAADEEHRANRLDRPDAADGDAERVLERLAGLFVESAEDLLHRPPHRILETPARQCFRHGIDVVDDGIGIGGDDAVADRLQSDLGAFLLAEERFLVELSLRDVELDTDEAQQASVFVHTCRCTADDPTPLAIAVTHAVSALEDRRL